MDNDTRRQEGGYLRRLPAVLGNAEGTSELSGDYVLPEYRPEIQRILRVRASVAPPDTYLTSSSVELIGSVEYRILYCGGDGALYSISEGAEYRITLPISLPADALPEEGVICDAFCTAETPFCRVTGPRKLSVRCRLRGGVRILGSRLPTEAADRLTEESCEMLLGHVEGMRAFVGTGELLSLAEEIPLEGESSDLRVIAAEGEVFVGSAEAASGSVLCEGAVELLLLVCHESTPEEVSTLRRSVPFRTSIPVEGVEVNCEATARGICRDLSITVEERRILCELGVILSARAQRNEDVSFVKDLYSTAILCENQYRRLPIRHAMGCLNGNFSHSFSLASAEGSERKQEQVAQILARAVIDEVAEERGRCYLLGRCLCHLLLRREGEWITEEQESRFRYETDLPFVQECHCDAQATVVATRVRSDGDALVVDAEIAVSAALWSETEVSLLSKVLPGEALPVGEGVGVTVCYPGPTDTLWSVARRYHRPIGELLRSNGIPGEPGADASDSLEGIGYLLI